MDGNKTLTATFKLKEYTFGMKNDAAQGTVTVSPTLPASGKYTHGTVLTVVATPKVADGFFFSKWTSKADPTFAYGDSAKEVVTFSLIREDTLTANYAAIPAGNFGLVLKNTPVAGGTITASPSAKYYASGTTVNLTATPNIGYVFGSWSTNVTAGGTTNTGSVTISAGTTVEATFTRMNMLTVHVSPASPDSGGSVAISPLGSNGAEYYAANVVVNLTATPKTGYTFTGWSGAVTATTAATTVTMNGDKIVTAVFTPNTHNINVSANPSNGGTVSGGGSASYNDNINLTATPSTGWEFDGWYDINDSYVANSNPYAIKVSGNQTLFAKFSKIQYTVSANANNSIWGYVSRSPAQSTYEYGEQVTVIANTNGSGYRFVSWYESGLPVQNAGASYTFTVSKNASYVANFAKNTYTLTFNQSAGGTIKPTRRNGATVAETMRQFEYLDTVEINAASDNGYEFNEFNQWNAGGNIELLQTGIPHVAHAVIHGSGTIEGRFIRQGEGRELYLYGDFSRGDVIVEYSENNGAYRTAEYFHNPGSQTNNISLSRGAMVRLTAAPEPGNIFSGWRFNSPNVNPVMSLPPFTMDNNYAVYFAFVKAEYYVNPRSNNPSWGTVSVSPGSGAYVYNYDDTATLTATPFAGYELEKWTYINSNGVSVDTVGNPLRIQMRSSVNPTAVFRERTYNITVNVTPAGSGSFQGTSTGLSLNASTTLTPVPNTGYEFEEWSGDTASTTASNEAIVTVTGDNMTVNLKFKPIKYALTLSATDQTDNGTIKAYSGGSGNWSAITNTNSIDYGTTVLLVATPKTEEGKTYKFKSWTGANVNDLTGQSNDSAYIVITGAKTISATFVQAHKVTLKVASNINDDVGGTLTSGDLVVNSSTAKDTLIEDQGTLSLTAAEKTNFDFVALVSGTYISESSDTTWLSQAPTKTVSLTGINKDIVVTAVFNRDSLKLTTNASGTDLGTVSISADPTSQPSNSSTDGYYWKGSTLTLTRAAPTSSNGETYRFVGWFVGESTTPASTTGNTYEVTLTAETKVIAKYVQTFKVTLSADENSVESGGTITVKVGENGSYVAWDADMVFDSGDAVYVKFTPAQGNKVTVTKESTTETLGEDNVLTIENISAAVEYTYKFETNS
jgi:uncharacterized repeat protein (TIGR02543 family)